MDGEERNTKIISKYGYTYIIVEMTKQDLNKRTEIPSFMGNFGWALQSIVKLKRNNKPCKKEKYGP